MNSSRHSKVVALVPLLVATLVAVHCTLVPADAVAGGLYFTERGVRPLARGGAFAAGADDLGAIWYNPAGIYDAGSAFLLDASWLDHNVEYTRRAILQQRDPNTGALISEFEQTFPTVDGSSPIVPIPTLAGSYKVHPDVVLALGVFAPYTAISTYPETVDDKPAPQRYSLVTLEGSALVVVGAYVAWAPIEEIRVGAGFEMLVGKFVATTMFGACVPERFFCAPEQPEWDALTELSVSPIVAPSGNLGVKWLPHEQWTVGAAFHLPTWINAPASVRTRLPATPAFETAEQTGEDATVSFELPWILRLGVQFEPVEDLMLELDGVIEGWDMHDEITVEPDGIVLSNVVGFPNPTRIPNQTIPRNFQNSYAVRFGGEYAIDTGLEVDIVPRLGLSYESSAIPPEYLSALTVDMDKFTLAIGGGVASGPWRFDFVYAHVFASDVIVEPEDAKQPQLSPLEANLSAPHIINGGDYSAYANVVGIGITYKFDDPDVSAVDAEDNEEAVDAEKAAPTSDASEASDDADDDDDDEDADDDDDDGGDDDDDSDDDDDDSDDDDDT